MSHRSIENLIEGLSLHGKREGSGDFTLAPDRVWAGLAPSVSDPTAFPRYILRWLVLSSPEVIQVSRRGSELEFLAPLSENTALAKLPFDFSGRDVDLARAVICSGMTGAQKFSVLLEDQGRSVEIPLSNSGAGTSIATRVDGNDRSLRVRLKSGEKKIIAQWKAIAERQFALSPIPVIWEKKPLTKSLKLENDPLIWKRLLPGVGEGRRFNFQAPPRSVESFVTTRPWDYEVLLGLTSQEVTSLKVLYRGDLFHFERPGFLPGFEIVVGTNTLSTDMQGLSLVANTEFESTLNSLRGEAYDMILQLFHAEKRPTGPLLASYMTAFGGVLLYLLAENRFLEGSTLAEWCLESVPHLSNLQSPEARYTFLRCISLHLKLANRPHLAARLEKTIKSLMAEHGVNFQVQATLIDAHLEAKTRRNDNDLHSHHTRERLHLLALKAREAGRMEEAFGLYYELLQGHKHLTSDQLDLWFEVADLARDLEKIAHLKILLRSLKRSSQRGTLRLSPSIRARANLFADLVSR